MTIIDRLESFLKEAPPLPWTGDRIDGTVKYSVLDANRNPVITGDNGNSEHGPYGILCDDAFVLAAFNALPKLIALARTTDRLMAWVHNVLDEPRACAEYKADVNAVLQALADLEK
jgi:hypothetical protein